MNPLTLGSSVDVLNPREMFTITVTYLAQLLCCLENRAAEYILQSYSITNITLS